MGSSLNVALPAIGTEFSLSAVLLSWIPTADLLASSMLLVPMGRLADIIGRRRVFLYGIALYTLSSGLCALAPSAGFLIAMRAVQGVSAALMFGISIAILTSVFPPQERGKALGINSAAVYVGLSLGPFIGGIMTSQWGWRSLFWANVPLGILMITLVLTRMRTEWTESRGARFDIPGSILYSISLVALMYGFSELPGIAGAVLVTGGVAGLALFIRFERRTASPVLDINLFLQNRVFALSNLSAFVNYSATFAVTFLLSLYLAYIRGHTPQEAGTVLVIQPIMMAVCSPFAGRLSDRVEPRIIASTGMGVIVAGLIALAFLTTTTPLWYIIAALGLLGIGFGMFSSPNTNAVMSSVERSVYGVAAGTLATMRMTGQTISIGIAMLIFALVVGTVQITPEYHAGFLRSLSIAFAVFAALCTVGVFSSLARGRVR
ncbi:MAG: MFS transporter [Bacteroidetes bacterium]|nr:MFS transporter [Bacteroidota bacterium]